MKCRACRREHYGFCLDERIPLSKRLAASVEVDGDRIGDYTEYVLIPSARKAVIKQVKYMEEQLRAIKMDSLLTQKIKLTEK